MEITTPGGYHKAVLSFKVSGLSKFWGHLPGNECYKHIVGVFAGCAIC